jgi:hypothetical protein
MVEPAAPNLHDSSFALAQETHLDQGIGVEHLALAIATADIPAAKFRPCA